MRVLVTGGTGLVGAAVVRALSEHGHLVRVLTRDANGQDRSEMGAAEFQRGDVGDALSIKGAAQGCDAIVHLAGILREEPPEQTFARINVEGTRHVLQEARRARVTRVVYMSSLGAERGHSSYHQSKLRAEEAIRGYGGEWSIVRPGNVYGPGVGTIALFLRLVRTLPVVPAVGDADIRFQPIWVRDLAEAVARVTERRDLAGRILELAGDETTSQRELFERFRDLTSRKPPLVVLPGAFVSTGARLLEALHVTSPITEDQVTMYEEWNVLPGGGRNDLREVLGIEPLPLEDGLALLAYATPEQLPSSGTGRLVRRKFWIDIEGSTLEPEEAITLVQNDFANLLPHGTARVGNEDLSSTVLKPHATITLSLPIRGNVQIRVEEVTPRSITCLTLLGHPLAGAVRFIAERIGTRLRFIVETIDRPSNFFDGLAMATVGMSLKRITWARMIQTVCERAGGKAPNGVEHAEETLDREQSMAVEEWMRRLVEERESAEAEERSDRGIDAHRRSDHSPSMRPRKDEGIVESRLP
jgi:nucleoside-diphosphate-sugar epimerase